MRMKGRVLALAATLTTVGCVGLVGALSASAATAACGASCVSIFSRELGTYAQPNFVEDVFQGVAQVGQPVVLKAASSSDPSEDTIPHTGLVSDFFAAGMVSADVNQHYGNLNAAQLEYAPSGVASGLCVGLATIAYQNEALTLQPCSVPATTVWIIDTADSPSTAPAYFPIVSGSTTDFSNPFAMSLPRNAQATGDSTPPIIARRLQFLSEEHTLPNRQLWGVLRGAVT